MANSPQAKKRARQAETNRKRNVSLRSMVRTYIKNTLNAIDAGDKDKAQTALTIVLPVLDSMVNKGIMHKNKAARHKSRLNAKVKALA
ncbi:MAG: 30S ribosomal protein S20 [Moraxellaceae bacterium]|nr:MAG: 30S ribosomal protein S20 [Moraxellaceae bacterium]